MFKPERRDFFKTTVDDGLHQRGDILPGDRDRRMLLVSDPVHDRLFIFPRKRPPSGDQFIQNHPERPDIGKVSDRIALQLFGRHVGNCAGGAGSLIAVNRKSVLGKAKISNLRDAFLCKNDILRLDVSVDYPFLMCGGKPFGNLDCNID